MRPPRFRLSTMMGGIALLALFLTVGVQAVLLQRAAVRERRLLAEAEQQRAAAERNHRLARDAVDQMLTVIAKRDASGPEVSGQAVQPSVPQSGAGTSPPEAK